ncbi:MAG TPA: peptidylprolyl isomerase SurA [Woeseiaceae bacterium]|nr:peptidylprolyl isomerase SurA [Woeseiaceae bacterium]
MCILCSGLAAALPGAAEELSETGQMLDGIAAVVNEGVVLKSELEDQTQAIRQRAQNENLQLPPEKVLREQVLERLIVEQIQLQRADRFGIRISDQMVNAALARLAQQNNIPFEQLPQVLASDGIDYAAYRQDIRKQLTLEQLRQIDVVNRITVSPREIQQCIADLENNVVGNSEYNLSHILISVPESATAEQFAEAEAEAQNVYTQLQNGADFGELAVRYSDSQTGLEGGSLGWRKGDQLPTIFSDVVGDMQAGDISKPMRAVSGFHIIKINDIRGATQKSEIEQMHIRHILISPNEIIDDETAKQRLNEAVEKIRSGEDEFGELAKLMSDDPTSKNEGGDLGWQGPGTFVPEFEKVAENAEIGEVSEPFKTRFGWHILEVLERRTYDNTEDLKESNCVQRVRNSKLADESELWVRRLRDEAYVDTRI